MLNAIQRFVRDYFKSFSFVGLVLATLNFAGSVTPSLLPRPYLVQGVLSGFAIAIGYGIGVGLVHFWKFLELPKASGKVEYWSKRFSAMVVAVIVVFFVWRSTEWQNSIRELMEMPKVETAYPFRFFGISLFVAFVLISLARGILGLKQVVRDKLTRFLPPRVAFTLSGLLVGSLVVFIANGVIARTALNFADRVFQRADGLIDEGIEQPTESMACGSPDSLIRWDDIGRRGKNFISGGPSQQSIQDWFAQNAVDTKAFVDEVKQPIRVYAGMNAGDNEAERARLVLEEMKRVGAFDRSVLIVATPTGTGWLDPGGVDTIEYLHRGDTATVSIQYSYLPSWITILIDPTRSIRSSHALFSEVYTYWRTLPKESRPRLYQYGLSLGSLGAEAATDLFEVFEDPHHGALLSGPPFPSRRHSEIISRRQMDSPAWLPRYRDERMVRFTNQDNYLNSEKPWGPIRSVYIQYASDPMIWFSPNLAWAPPAWLREPRGPDVSPQLRWYPIVTFLQIGFDLPMATSVPTGYGHNYSPSHYIDGWVAVTQPVGWSKGAIEQLKAYFYAAEQPAASNN
jgi:uncharacterized membrane protein